MILLCADMQKFKANQSNNKSKDSFNVVPHEKRADGVYFWKIITRVEKNEKMTWKTQSIYQKHLEKFP